MNRLLILLSILLLSACALAPPPPPADRAATHCLDLYAALDQAVAENGVTPSTPTSGSRFSLSACGSLSGQLQRSIFGCRRPRCLADSISDSGPPESTNRISRTTAGDTDGLARSPCRLRNAGTPPCRLFPATTDPRPQQSRALGADTGKSRSSIRIPDSSIECLVCIH